MTIRKVTLYVKSDKKVVGETQVKEPHLIKKGVPRMGFWKHFDDVGWDAAFEDRVEIVHDFVLPAEQEATVEVVKEVCEKHDVEVTVVDVAREDVIHRALQEEVKKLRIFPTLIADSGKKIEGCLSRQQVESLLS